jgi:hypothetical protein
VNFHHVFNSGYRTARFFMVPKKPWHIHFTLPVILILCQTNTGHIFKLCLLSIHFNVFLLRSALPKIFKALILFLRVCVYVKYSVSRISNILCNTLYLGNFRLSLSLLFVFSSFCLSLRYSSFFPVYLDQYFTPCFRAFSVHMACLLQKMQFKPASMGVILSILCEIHG